jgi:uncharacterized protein (TIGR03435 family)
MSSHYLPGLANHLWQSTLFVAVVWLITRALRENRAAIRHRVWVIASMKFLLPFSFLITFGNAFTWQTAPQAPAIVERMSRPFSVTATPQIGPTSVVSAEPTATQSTGDWIPAMLFSIWACGFVANVIWWPVGWMRLRRTLRQAIRVNLDFPLRVMASSERVEPGVFGIFNPILLIPVGIASRLSAKEMQAVLAHELCHVQRRDNLTAAFHMLVEAVFWFHPLVWWIRARLIEEQERACDEEVLSLGSDPQIYAESILKICEFYVRSPLICVSGITGPDLKKRIAEIVSHRPKPSLSHSRLLLLVVTLLFCIAAPFTAGVFHSQGTRPSVPGLWFDAASVRIVTAGQAKDQQLAIGLHCRGIDGELYSPPNALPSTAPIGRCTGITDGYYLLHLAYGRVHDDRLRIINLPAEFDLPSGPDGALYQIQAIAPNPSRVTKAELQQMLQALLRDRFKLKIRTEKRDVEGFDMTIGKSGIKFKETPLEEEQCCRLQLLNPEAQGAGGTLTLMIKGRFRMKPIAQFVSDFLGRGFDGPPVADKTNLPGVYDITLLLNQVLPISGGGRGGGGGRGREPFEFDPPIPRTLEEQLGLHLERGKVSAEYWIIDHIEKPTEN